MFGQGLSVCGEEVNSFSVNRQSRKFRTQPHKHFVISRMESKVKGERIAQLKSIPVRGRAIQNTCPAQREARILPVCNGSQCGGQICASFILPREKCLLLDYHLSLRN